MNTFSSVSEGALCSYRVELSPRLMGLLGECSKPELRSLLTFFHSSFLSVRLTEDVLPLFLSEESELSDDEELSPPSPSALSPPLPPLVPSLLVSAAAASASAFGREDDDVPSAAAAVAFAAAADAAAACCLPLTKILKKVDIRCH